MRIWVSFIIDVYYDPFSHVLFHNLEYECMLYPWQILSLYGVSNLRDVTWRDDPGIYRNLKYGTWRWSNITQTLLPTFKPLSSNPIYTLIHSLFHSPQAWIPSSQKHLQIHKKTWTIQHHFSFQDHHVTSRRLDTPYTSCMYSTPSLIRTEVFRLKEICSD